MPLYACAPPASQALAAASSSAQVMVSGAPSAESQANEASPSSRIAPCGVPPVNETTGATVSTSKPLSATVVLPAASTAFTCSVCAPSPSSATGPQAP
jgi:hypothetical protein